MNVVIDARESGTSTGRYIDKLVEYLYKLEPRLEITVLTKKHRIDYLKKVAPSFKVIESNYKEFTFSEQLGFAWQLYKLKPGLVHFGMTHQPILYFGKAVTTVHDLTTLRFDNPAKNRLIFKLKQWVYRCVIWIAAHKSKRIIAPSNWVKKDLAKFARIRPSKIAVTYEAADKIADRAEPLPDFQAGSFIMYVGRPMPHKNLRRLMEAFSILRHSRPELKLVLVGQKDKVYKQLEDWARKEKIEGIIFTGYVSDGQLRWLYEHTATYVFPSLSEGFGLPGLEAMRHGAPVISSNTTSLPEIYRDGAAYFSPLSVQSMVSKISLVLDSPKHAQRLVEKANKVVDGYSWQRMAKQTSDIYSKILNK